MCNGSADSQTSESADYLLIFENYQQYTVLITEMASWYLLRTTCALLLFKSDIMDN